MIGGSFPFENGIRHQLEELFGEFETADELHQHIEDTKFHSRFSIFKELDLSETEKRENYLKASNFLLTQWHRDHEYIMDNALLRKPDKPSTYPYKIAILRLWALLISEAFNTVVRAFSEGNSSLVDVLIGDWPEYANEENKEIARWQYAFFLLKETLQAMEDSEKALCANMAGVMAQHEMAAIAEQKRNPRPEEPYYWQARHLLHIRINPYHDIESIMAEVRRIVEERHVKMRDDENEEINPLLQFTYTDPENKNKRSESKFFEVSFRALIVFELQQKMAPVDIARQFFGVDKHPDLYPNVTKDISVMTKKAKALIQKALSGAPLQS